MTVTACGGSGTSSADQVRAALSKIQTAAAAYSQDAYSDHETPAEAKAICDLATQDTSCPSDFVFQAAGLGADYLHPQSTDISVNGDSATATVVYPRDPRYGYPGTLKAVYELVLTGGEWKFTAVKNAT